MRGSGETRRRKSVVCSNLQPALCRRTLEKMALGWRLTTARGCAHELELAGMHRGPWKWCGQKAGQRVANTARAVALPCPPRDGASKTFCVFSSVPPRNHAQFTRNAPRQHACSKTCSIDAPELLACFPTGAELGQMRLAITRGRARPRYRSMDPPSISVSFLACLPSSQFGRLQYKLFSHLVFPTTSILRLIFAVVKILWFHSWWKLPVADRLISCNTFAFLLLVKPRRRKCIPEQSPQDDNANCT